MKRFSIYLMFICSSIVSFCFAQKKYEKESRIYPSQVPEASLNFVRTLPFNKKIKWYKEENLDTYTFEAKTKYKRKRYSVEFDKEGILEDIEITLSKKKVPKEIYGKIKRYFHEQYAYHRIQKIQLQLTGSQELLLEQIKQLNHHLPKGHYEIVVKIKKNGEFQLKEYLFSPEGLAIKSVTIIFENTFHLEF